MSTDFVKILLFLLCAPDTLSLGKDYWESVISVLEEI